MKISTIITILTLSLTSLIYADGVTLHNPDLNGYVHVSNTHDGNREDYYIARSKISAIRSINIDKDRNEGNTARVTISFGPGGYTGFFPTDKEAKSFIQRILNGK